MRKVHLKVTLDVLVHADEDAKVIDAFNNHLEFVVRGGIGDRGSQLYPDDYGLDIIDIHIDGLEVTDSR